MGRWLRNVFQSDWNHAAQVSVLLFPVSRPSCFCFVVSLRAVVVGCQP